MLLALRDVIEGAVVEIFLQETATHVRAYRTRATDATQSLRQISSGLM